MEFSWVSSGSHHSVRPLMVPGNAFKDLKDVKVYPSIGMKRPHAQLSVNFGQKPFVFDIDGMMSVSTSSG